MDQKATKFLSKMRIKPNDILYFVHEERKTVITLTDGKFYETYIPLKYLLSALPKGAFINITKGVVIAANQIKHIQGHTYTMNDGRQFTGRKRGAGEHKKNRHKLENIETPQHRLQLETIHERFSVMDAAPIPIYVIELVFNSAGHTVDFAFRYCNPAVSKLDGFTVEELLDRTYYDVFAIHSDDRQRLSTYTDVALNGTSKSLLNTKTITGKKVDIFCHQPLPGYCACLLVPLD